MVKKIPVVGEHKREQDECNELGSVGFSGGDADFRSGVQMDAAVRLPRDGATDGVGDAHTEGGSGLAIAQRFHRVRSFARL